MNRRQFIKGIGAIGLAGLLPPLELLAPVERINSIFTGAMGRFEGCILYQHPRTPYGMRMKGKEALQVYFAEDHDRQVFHIK